MNYRVGQLVTIKDRRPMFDSPVPITAIQYEQIGYPQVVEVLLRNGHKYTLNVRDIEPWRTDYIERIRELERVADKQEQELTVLRAECNHLKAQLHNDLWEPPSQRPAYHLIKHPAQIGDVKPHAAWEAEG
jgi:hypothetical protein